MRIMRIFSPTLDALLKRIEQSPGIPVPNPSASYWIKPPSPVATHGAGPEEKLPTYADVVIIGSGITGTSVARTLLDWQRDHWKNVEPLRVVMLEARDACSGATGRNGGHIFPQLYAEYTHFKKDYGIETAKQIIRFRLLHLPQLLAVAVEERLEVDSQCREVQAFDVYQDCGMYQAAKEKLAMYCADLPEESVDFRIHEGEGNLKDLHLSNRTIGCLSTRAGAMHPYRFVTGILSRLLREYSTNFYLFTQTPCTDISSSKSGSSDLYNVFTPKGVIKTPHIIHATNAWASHLLPAMRRRIVPVRGVMSAQLRRGPGKTPEVGSPERRSEEQSSGTGGRSFVFFSGGGYDYLTQQPAREGKAQREDSPYPPPSGELMFGGGLAGKDTFLTEIGNADDKGWNVKTGAYLEHALENYFQLNEPDEATEEGRVQGLWSGIIGVSVDGMPWIGRIPTKLSRRRAPRVPAMSSGKLQKVTGSISSEALSRLAAPGEWIAAGYSGEGMVHGWMSGKALAYMILDQDKGVKERSGKEFLSVELEKWFPNVFRISKERFESAAIEGLM